MKFFLLSLCCIIGTSSFSQGKLSVKYTQQFLTLTNKLDDNGNPIYRWASSSNYFRLNVLDELASFRSNYPPNNTDAVRYPYAHYSYTDVASGHLYIPVPKLTERELMIEDSIKTYNWKFTDMVDIICGFSCRQAVAVRGSGYVYAWYAYDLPKLFGPFNYTGLPGTVLAVEFSESSVRYIAVDVNEDAEPVVIPKTALISLENYTALSREKRKYRAGLFGKRVDPYEVPKLNASNIKSKYLENPLIRGEKTENPIVDELNNRYNRFFTP